jgi:dienelactone hydrolase
LPLPPAIAAYYTYPSLPRDVTVTPGRATAQYRESVVRFPLSVPADMQPTEPEVEFEWYESQRPGRRPAILFNPILGGDYPLERGICRTLARQGFHVALIHRKTLKISPEHDVSHLELLLRQGIFRIRQVVDWMAAHERVDAERMGSFGVSMGGMASVMTAAVEPRLKAHVVVLAGGSLADILSTSKDTLLTKPRARYLKAHHMTTEEMAQRLRETVKTDPLLLAPYVDPARLRVFIALSDRTIGRANALRLWRALGRPEATFMPTGHYTSYLLLPYLKYAGGRYLKQALGVGYTSSNGAPQLPPRNDRRQD